MIKPTRDEVLADLLTLLVIAIVGLGIYGLLKPSANKIWSARHRPKPPAGPSGPAAMADLKWSVQDLAGNTVPVSQFSGKVLFINFWATWCGPCRMEMPSIDYLQRKFKEEDVVFLLISNEEIKTLKAYLEKTPSEAPVYHADAIPAVYETEGLPTTFIISRSGFIVKTIVGARDWSKKKNVQLLAELLAENPNLKETHK